MNLLVVLTNDWGYTHGGINVFNREMCEGFSEYISSQLHVICLAPNIKEENTNVKSYKKIELISVNENEFKDSGELVKIVQNYCTNRNYNVSSVTWLGHDTYSDSQAIGCRERWPGSRCAVIHHMSYSTYYPLLNTDASEIKKKEDQQKARLREADVVFANGPLLKKSAQDLCGGEKDVFEILPGVYDDENMAENTREDYISNEFKVVTFGRVESAEGTKRNNSIIKQVFLAVAAWAEFANTLLPDAESTMKVYGKSDDAGDEEVQEEIMKHQDKLRSCTLLPYETNHKKLLEELKDYSLCLVLSSKEGFGLTALEAISAGVPVIVSESSGFFQSLRDRLIDGYVYSIPVEGSLREPYYTKNDLRIAIDKIKEVYTYQDKAKEKTKILKEKLITEGYTWNNCARTILEKLGWLDETIVGKENGKRDKQVMPEYSLAEHFVIGHDMENMRNSGKENINDAFNAAQLYSVCQTPFYNQPATYDEQLFRNISVDEISIRLLYAQEPYLHTYIIRLLDLNAIEAVRYGLRYGDCDFDINMYEEEGYPLSETERKRKEVAEKIEKQLRKHTIPESEINRYPLLVLMNRGYSISDLCQMHYDINILVRFETNRENLKDYYSEEEIVPAVKLAEELLEIIESPALGKYEQFGPNYLSKKFSAKAVLEVFSVEEIFHAYDIKEICAVQPMVSAKALKKGGFSAEELANSRFSQRQVAAAGFETEKVVFDHRSLERVEFDSLREVAEEITYELEEEDKDESFYLCHSCDAELLKRLKERGFGLGQIMECECLPFISESYPEHVKWLLMARYTIDELESENIAWKNYFKDLPVGEWIDNEEYEKYQYDGVLPMELLKAGVNPDTIKSVYEIEDILNMGETKKENVQTLRKYGFTAKAFFYMGKSLEEIMSAYCCDKGEDIREMALSQYELKDLRKKGFSIVQLKE